VALRVPGCFPVLPQLQIINPHINIFAVHLFPIFQVFSSQVFEIFQLFERPFFILSVVQRLRRHFFQMTLVQPQHAMAAPGKLKIVGRDQGRQRMLTVQLRN
jgi:hypothetical protein